VGTGTVLTRDVPAGALAIARAKQAVKEGWAKRLRQVKALGKNLAGKKRKKS
jgi:bifunctional UDP-N-acetylglucosamine pyrophosphorylase/glucosamine-1-phosphate N-acetyltransferase